MNTSQLSLKMMESMFIKLHFQQSGAKDVTEQNNSLTYNLQLTLYNIQFTQMFILVLWYTTGYVFHSKQHTDSG